MSIIIAPIIRMQDITSRDELAMIFSSMHAYPRPKLTVPNITNHTPILYPPHFSHIIALGCALLKHYFLWVIKFIRSACVLVLIIEFTYTHASVAEQIPAGQGVGESMRHYSDTNRDEDIQEKIRTKKTKRPRLDTPELQVLPQNMRSVRVAEIIIQHDLCIKPLISEDLLMRMNELYKNKELSLDEIKKIPGEFMVQLNDKGLKAYIPVQSFKDGIIYINLIPQKD